jgi:hypothetical protein
MRLPKIEISEPHLKHKQRKLQQSQSLHGIFTSRNSNPINLHISNALDQRTRSNVSDNSYQIKIDKEEELHPNIIK